MAVKFKYRGILAKPMPSKHSGDPNEMNKRWHALFDAHEVKYGHAYDLLWQLVIAHVRGFRVARRPGPQTTWDDGTLVKLYIAVQEYVAEREKPGQTITITQACRDLSVRDPWKSKLRGGRKNPTQALREHYNESLVRWKEWRKQIMPYISKK
jgi:hypothetical protein